MKKSPHKNEVCRPCNALINFHYVQLDENVTIQSHTGPYEMITGLGYECHDEALEQVRFFQQIANCILMVILRNLQHMRKLL